MVKYRLPYNEHLVPDLVLGHLIRMCLAEDWEAQQLFNVIDKQGFVDDTQVPRMRRYLHTIRLFETEIRMRTKERGYHEL